MNKTYTEKLKLFFEVDFADTKDAAEYSADLLRWTLASILLGKPIEKGKEWLHSQLQKPAFEDKVLIKFLRFANLAAVEKLVGENSRQTLQNALDLLPEVEKETMFDTDVALVKEVAIGLWLAAGNENEKSVWREKRLAQESYEGWKASAFEILYSSGDRALDESLDDLVRASARVAVKTLRDRNLNSVAPLVFALSAHSAGKNESLLSILNGEIFSLDKAVFGNGDIPLLNFDKTGIRSISKDSDTLVIRISQGVTGVGKLSTGNYEFESFTTGLVSIVTKSFEKRKDQESIKNIEIEGVLKLADKVEIDDEQFANLERRMSVAVEHSINYLEIFDKQVSFNIKLTGH